MEVTGEVGSTDEGIGTGRIKHAGVGDLFKGGSTGNYSIWVRDVET